MTHPKFIWARINAANRRMYNSQTYWEWRSEVLVIRMSAWDCPTFDIDTRRQARRSDD